MKKIVVLGGGESGVGAALLAQEKGHPVFVSDAGTLKLKYREVLEKNNIPYEENAHTKKKIFEADLIVKSPGIPDQTDLIQELQKEKIPVISEIEYAGKHTNAIIIGITGSNGKTTTTNLTYHLLKAGGMDVGMGGNIGRSFAEMIATEPHEIYVLELSSFQLDGIDYFQPDVAILLNITPDHLDRYDYKMEQYVAAKFRIIKNQEAEDVFIYNGDDERINVWLTKSTLAPRGIVVNNDTSKKGTKLIVNELEFDLKKSGLKGPHNRFNASCAIHAALLQNVSQTDIQQGLDTFINAPHRLQEVAIIDEVTYINDSKATNTDAVYHALLSMEQPTVLIIGGVDKGNDYSVLLPLAKEKVTALICLGNNNEKIKAAFKEVVNHIEETTSMKEAIDKAQAFAKNGETILLSPACASFDLFKNYIDRGEQFIEAVHNLEKK